MYREEPRLLSIRSSLPVTSKTALMLFPICIRSASRCDLRAASVSTRVGDPKASEMKLPRVAEVARDFPAKTCEVIILNFVLQPGTRVDHRDFSRNPPGVGSVDLLSLCILPRMYGAFVDGLKAERSTVAANSQALAR